MAESARARTQPSGTTFALYVGIGFLISGVLHAWVWWGSETLATWWVPPERESHEGITPKLALVAGSAYGLVAGGAAFAFLHRTHSARVLVYGGMLGVCVVVVGSQIIASSLTKVVYEIVIATVALGGFGLEHFLQQQRRSLTARGVGRILVASAKATVVGLAALAGTFAATIIGALPEGEAVTGREVIRQMVLGLYVVLGIAFLVFAPMLIRVLEPWLRRRSTEKSGS